MPKRKEVNVRYLLTVMICGALPLLFLAGCSKRVGPTTVIVQDSVRHYYPVVSGQELDLQYNVANIGDVPLVITDVQPSCGCISVDGDNNNIVPPGKKITLKFKYRSEMNVGYVRHVIRLFGNIRPNGMAALVFDVNVVPQSGITRDYEEVYKDVSASRTGVEGLVNGDESERGYYVDIERDSRSHARFPWRDE